ncbi:MAG: hypothetical protein FJ254_01560 [Phycisphaerae bacterium]|nr:hypothetical protein [Phycisphaerae bacterium]
MPRADLLMMLLAAAVCLAPRTVLAQSCPASGDCLAPHTTPGCNDPSCCASTCAIDSTCCTVAWDADCAQLANTFCSICGASGLGSCFLAHTTSKCDNAVCCSTVCQFDAYCCTVRWDSTCAVYASAFCDATNPGTCGDPTSGGCDVPHGTPACDNADCCNAVCAKDPTCCTQAWDSLCVAYAAAACTAQCEPACPAGSVTENEQCGLYANDVCIAPVAGSQPQALTGGKGCGWLTYDALGGLQRVDVDVWSLTVPDPDGDGLARVTLGFTCNAGTFAALVPAGSCAIAQAPIHAQVSSCIEAVSQACIPAGSWWVICTSGAFPQQQAPSSYPCPGRPYSLRVEIDQVCVAPCSSDGPCLSPHPTPGCSDAECCAATCAVDPYCCEADWDASCVTEAVQACNIAPPPNDDCAGALALVPGTPLLVQTGPATISGLPFPPGCVGTGTVAGNDVWCSIGPLDRAATVLVSTCSESTLFDTLLVAYRGGCGALQAAGCNDTGLCPPQSNAELSIDVACGEVVLLRVVGRQGHLGQAQVLLTVPGAPPCPGSCPADLNGSGTVDGADLGLLLSSWGNMAGGDVNGDGITDGADLGALLSGWGPCQ